MTIDDYPLHHRSEVEVAVAPQRLFDWLDDARRLASHMEKPSLMTPNGQRRPACGQPSRRADSAHLN